MKKTRKHPKSCPNRFYKTCPNCKGEGYDENGISFDLGHPCDDCEDKGFVVTEAGLEILAFLEKMKIV